MKYFAKENDYERFLERLNRANHCEFGEDRPTTNHRLSIQLTGYPRSGTTLLYQLLANSRSVGYPSNVMAAYWRAPHVGATLQKALLAAAPPVKLESIGGRTSDPLGPHEFGYFWRELQGHDSMSLKPDRPPVAGNEVRRLLDLVNDAFDAPSVYKNFLAPTHHQYFSSEVGRSRFIDIRRDLRDTAASMVSLRRKLSIPPHTFLGPTPREPRPHYHSDIEMVCHQIADMNSVATEAEFEKSPHRLTIDYVNMCENPKQVVAEVLDFSEASHTSLNTELLPSSLTVSHPFENLERDSRFEMLNSLEREDLL